MNRVRQFRATALSLAIIVVAITAGGAQSLAGSSTVYSDDIVDGTITHADVKASSLGGSRFMDRSVTASKLADSSVSGGKVVDNSLTGSDINESTLSLPPLVWHEFGTGPGNGWVPPAWAKGRDGIVHLRGTRTLNMRDGEVSDIVGSVDAGAAPGGYITMPARGSNSFNVFPCEIRIDASGGITLINDSLCPQNTVRHVSLSGLSFPAG